MRTGEYVHNGERNGEQSKCATHSQTHQRHVRLVFPCKRLHATAIRRQVGQHVGARGTRSSRHHSARTSSAHLFKGLTTTTTTSHFNDILWMDAMLYCLINLFFSHS